jgi:hypothetical protein
MENWQNFFLQKATIDVSSTEPCYESVSTWGVWCSEIPFKLIGEVRAPAKRTWPDEHGDDEYIPDEGLYLESYTMDVKLGCKKTGTVSDVRENVGNFLTYLRTSGHLRLYSTYTRIGRQGVRLESVSDDAVWRSYDGEEFLVFTVTLRVVDPVTDITLGDMGITD